MKHPYMKLFNAILIKSTYSNQEPIGLIRMSASLNKFSCVLLLTALSLTFAVPVHAGRQGGGAKPTAPVAPSSLSGSAVSSSQINLTWTDNSANESGFYLDRATNSAGPWARIATLGINAKAYSNVGLTAGTYYYRVY